MPCEIGVRETPRLDPYDMPKAWTDREAWNRYYATGDPNDKHRAYLGGDADGWQLLSLDFWVRQLRQDEASQIWVPGCGLSVMPWVYSKFGFDVCGTDQATRAIQIQASSRFKEYASERLLRLLEAHGARFGDDIAPGSDGETAKFVACDHRSSFSREVFDAVLNVQAWDWTSPEDAVSTARVHYQALKPAGRCYLITRGVPPAIRNGLEQVLLDVGFHIPRYKAKHKYREAMLKARLSKPEWAFEPDEEDVDVVQGADEKELQLRRKLRGRYQKRSSRGKIWFDRRLHDGHTKVAEVHFY